MKDVILPYSHQINTYKGDIGIQNRKTLLFFMGNRYRKEGGKIQDLLFRMLEKEEDVIIKHGAQSSESLREATRGMHTSSDYIELPFEDVIDYRKIVVFIDSNTTVTPGNLVKLLRGMSSQKILEFQKEMQKVKRYFEYEDPDGTVKEIRRQVSPNQEAML